MDELNSGFSRYNGNNLATKASHIVTSLTGNAYFPAPTPALAAVQTAITAYADAVAAENTVAVLQLRKTSRKALIGLLKQLAASLELTANGDMVKLGTTGFDLRKAPTRHEGATGIPQSVRVKTTGTSGQALCKCQAVRPCDSYEIEHTLDPVDGPWVAAGSFSNSQKMLLTGLTRGKDYYFRIRAHGPNGPSGWSDVATMMVV